jgi:hypothetical protein
MVGLYGIFNNDIQTTFSKNCTKPNAYEKCFNDHIPKEE